MVSVKPAAAQSRAAPLPDKFEYAFGELTALTPSITCVMIAFVPKPKLRQAYDDALRRAWTTQMRRKGSAYTIMEPGSLKREAIEDIRSDMRSDALAWYKRNLPGVFASGHLENEMPSCELLTLRTAQIPVPRIEGQHRPEYLRVLRVAEDIDCWQSKSLSGLRFIWPLDRGHENAFHAAIVANEEVLARKSIYGKENTEPSSFPQVAHDHVKGLLPSWGLIPLLSGYHSALSRVRDADILSGRRGASLKVLRSLNDFTHDIRDITPITTELLEDADRGNAMWATNAGAFDPMNARFNGNEPLAKALVANIHRKARRLQRIEKSVQATITQSSSILSAYENLKIQERIRWLTIVAVILTIATVIMGVENSKTAREFWNGLPSLFERSAH